MEESSTRAAPLPTAQSKERNAQPIAPGDTAFGQPREFLDNRFVYLVVSERARGLSVGINFNPDKLCDFDCVYCEVDRRVNSVERLLDVDAMGAELVRTLNLVHANGLRKHAAFASLPEELLQLRHVTLSGDGEPTLCPQFGEAVKAVVHARALGDLPFFKLVLITNASGFDRPQVREGLKLLTRDDEIWAKLDGGTEDYLKRVNRPRTPLSRTLANILSVARERPVIIQSLFPAINGDEPPTSEIKEYALRLKELKKQGAQISLVQVYSATRPIVHPECTHLPLKTLSKIAQRVRDVSGLPAEVF